ncbi:sigma-E processing peptidase SpoIIGA [Clostridium intestinale]|uniref:Sporulation sigma-E factor-processing peptidase n=1 Tax=Clostridium intestinale URNW TaxID=1294142 RepID=U2PUP6_9CLOT|nr:sigma-E processing peptidase SpoIIGA [Clostridium intestinale]ERK30160.1 sigma-E processing peptidase spoiiga [Clostridium intestinale URNW]
MEINLDIFLIENFVINLFLIVIMMKLLRAKRKRRMEIIAAMVGAFYTLVMIFPEVSILAALPFRIIVAVIMVYIAMRCRNIKEILKGTLVLILTSFILSGVSFGFSLIGNGYSLEDGLTINNYPIKYLIISILTIFILVERIVNTIRDKMFVENYIYNLTIKYHSKEFYAKGFLDTGNELREPITDLPVIVVESDICKYADFNEKEAIYINIKTINGDGGKLKGFRVKDVVIENEKSKLIRDVIICLTENILSGEGAYNALLSRGIV